MAHDASLAYLRHYTLNLHMLPIAFMDGITGGDMNFEVINFLVDARMGLGHTLKIWHYPGKSLL